MRRNIWPTVKIVYFIIGVAIGVAISRFIFHYHWKSLSSCVGKTDNSFKIVHSVEKKENTLLFVGVMTADKFLDTRTKAVYETWGQSLQGKIIFFSSENSSSKANIPLVKLPNIDDSYPPQKKSFAMLKYMYQHYPNYEFYLRADDDLYVRPEKLQNFLSSINSSKPLLIGHPGYGVKKERPSLHLIKNQPFCMGGPGIIISNKALQLLYKHIDNCVQLSRTSHEDVEFWRCMQHYVGISCTKSDEVANYFYNYNGLGKKFTKAVHKKDVVNTLTLHPLKNHLQFYKLHEALQIMQIQDKESDIRQAMDEIWKTKQRLKDTLNSVKLDQAEEGIFFGSSAISNTETNGNEVWNLYHGRTYYTSNNIFGYETFKNSSLKVAKEDVEGYLLKSIIRPIFESEFYSRNLPGVGVEFIIHMRFPREVKSLRKLSGFRKRYNNIKKLRKHGRRHHVKIPYGTLNVRESVTNSFFSEFEG